MLFGSLPPRITPARQKPMFHPLGRIGLGRCIQFPFNDACGKQNRARTYRVTDLNQTRWCRARHQK